MAMRAGRLLRAVAATGLSLAASLCIAQAQTLEVLGQFNADGGEPEGRLSEGPPGTFYGATYYGGHLGRGSIYRLTLGAPATVEVFHGFAGPDGWGPGSGIVMGTGGYRYGSTGVGGVLGSGTVYRIDPSGRLTTAHDLDGYGSGVGDLLLASDGRMYGTSASGGSSFSGTIFRLDPDGSMHTLHEFSGADGARPSGGLVQASDGVFYGTTLSSGGGFDPPSTFFRIDGAGNFQSLHTFAVEDGYVTPVVLGPDGFFYGGSYNGGAQGAGTVFRIDGSGNFEKLHDVSVDAGEGSDVRFALVSAPDGNLWGTTYQGAQAGGTIFKISPSGQWTTVHSLGYADCANPNGPLVVGSDGWLYGVCQYAVAPGQEHGAVFRIDTSGNFEILWRFVNPDGRQPFSGVVEGLDGNVYGPTDSGGAQGYGTFFRMTAAGQFEFLHDFGPYPGNPYSTPTRASDGTIYGSSSGNGDSNLGFIYRFTPPGDFAILHSFAAGEGIGVSRLIEATDGNLYGVASAGGANGLGTVFRVSPDGTFATTHDMQSAEGGQPSHVVQATDGKLYFTAATPPNQFSQSAVLRIDLAGTNLETVASFPVSAGPPMGLIQGTNGDFYGTSFFGSNPSAGNVFHLDSTDTFSSLHDFSGLEGRQPYGGVVQADDGALYGTTLQGNSTTYGTLFRVSTAGDFATLWDFHATDGAHPGSPLSKGTDGALYGSSGGGFAFGEGVLFRWLLAFASPAVSSIAPGSGPASGHTAVEIQGSHFQTVPTLTFGGTPALSAIGIDVRTTLAMSPALPAGTLNDVVLTNPDEGSATLAGAWFADYLDIESINPFHDFVEAIARARITAGCGGGNYCGANPVSRAQMAVFLLKAKNGSSFVPPSCAGLFADVACPGGFAVDWIEELANEQITSGCGGGDYCPNDPVRRDQMAVFLLKAHLGSGYVPPVATGAVFADVPASAFAADWIEDLYARSVTGGCLTNPLRYCPTNTNNRQQMAVFITKTFGLP